MSEDFHSYLERTEWTQHSLINKTNDANVEESQKKIKKIIEKKKEDFEFELWTTLQASRSIK